MTDYNPRVGAVLEARGGIAAFLRENGMFYGDIDFGRERDKLAAAMEEGLLPGSRGSLAMLPTYIGSAAPPRNRRVIVLDAGGTNFRAALVAFGKDAVPSVEYFQKYPMPGTMGELGKDEFFDELAARVEPIIDGGDEIGFCFSYPMEILRNGDGRILQLTKEVRVRGAEGAPVGAELIAALKRRGKAVDKRVVLLNDTVACLLGGLGVNPGRRYSSLVGFILGTGFNACYMEQSRKIGKLEDSGVSREMIINIELGGFDEPPAGRFDDELDHNCANKGRQRLEKMVAGAYQGGLFRAVLRGAADALIFETPPDFGRLAHITAKDVNEFLDAPRAEETALAACFHGEEDRAAAHALADLIAERTALLTAVAFAAAIRKAGSKTSPDEPAMVAAEGTTFYKSKQFRKKLDVYIQKHIREEMGEYLDLVTAENLTLFGTARAAAGAL